MQSCQYYHVWDVHTAMCTLLATAQQNNNCISPGTVVMIENGWEELALSYFQKGYTKIQIPLDLKAIITLKTERVRKAEPRQIQPCFQSPVLAFNFQFAS